MPLATAFGVSVIFFYSCCFNAMIEELYNIYLQHPKICTDSRRLQAGDLFFAFKGEHFDANAFVDQALDLGASVCIVENKAFVNHDRCFVVDNVLQVLQDLAAYHRSQLNIPVLGITGSNGKTTTKELIHAILSTTFRTHATQGNFNNHLGVPLTLLSMPLDTEIAVIEMGANHPEDIADLCKICKPDLGIITNIGKAHLEGFGSFEGVIHAKKALYDYLRHSNGLVFVNAENQLLLSLCDGMKIISYGDSPHADLRGRLTKIFPHLEIEVQNERFSSSLIGSYNFLNIMSALAVGKYFRVPLKEACAAIADYNPENHRSQMVNTSLNTLILDCYNANPSSMKIALSDFDKANFPHKTAILGAMKELGKYSTKMHEEVVTQALSISLDHVFFVGDEFRNLCKKETFFENVDSLKEYIKQHPLHDQSIFIKGSHSVKLEELQDVL